MNDTNEIKSIWDGWERQCFGKMFEGHGATCAVGYVCSREIGQVFPRVAAYLRENYSIPLSPRHPGGRMMDTSTDFDCIVYANNVLKLTPEQFREIDRLTQIEAVSKPLIDSAEIAVGVGQ